MSRGRKLVRFLRVSYALTAFFLAELQAGVRARLRG